MEFINKRVSLGNTGFIYISALSWKPVEANPLSSKVQDRDREAI